jgi:hypothetical protein
MALFNRGSGGKPAGAGPTPDIHPTLGKSAHCNTCGTTQAFTRSWLRVKQVTQCTCCGNALPNAAELYKKRQPACPTCGEWLEQPGFEYGLCDGCGSKYEITEGCKPSLIPNQKQRAEMDKIGRAWSRD